MNIKKSWVSNAIVLAWCLSFLSSFALADEMETLQMEPAKKPVYCTSKFEYDTVKSYFKEEYGEVGVIRYVTKVPSIIEVFISPKTGTTTILEFLLETNSTCVLSTGQGAEFNQNFGKSGIGA
jgi:hypothetical protein